MRRFQNICWWFILLAVVGFSHPAFTQSGRVAEQGYYLVINAYAKSKESYAQRYFDQIAADGDQVHYAYVPSKKMYFVYLEHYLNFKESIAAMRLAREDTRFPEAWVFVSKEKFVMEEYKNSISESSSNPAKVKEKEPVLLASTKEVVIDHIALEELDQQLEPPSEAAPQWVFVLNNSRNNEEVKGEVQIVDTERSKLLNVQEAGEIVQVQDPKNGSGDLTLIADIFGYRKQQKEVNIASLDDSEDVRGVNDYFVVFFDMVRYHVGDIATMYNVYFYSDASIMRPESRYEVNSLLAMMQENPGYKIRIHGHTNGRRAGKIITRGESDEFFALKDENKESTGTAKLLSKRRAELIRDYLISEGISHDRMEIKAWGGSRMLFDKNGTNAPKNVRVEIEIIAE